MKVKIQVHPNSKNPRLEVSAGDIKIFVREQAREGKANRAAAEVLAKHFKVPKSCIRLLRGGKSRIKTFEI